MQEKLVTLFSKDDNCDKLKTAEINWIAAVMSLRWVLTTVNANMSLVAPAEPVALHDMCKHGTLEYGRLMLSPCRQTSYPNHIGNSDTESNPCWE